MLRRSTGTLAVNKDTKAKPKSYNAIRKDLAGIVLTRVILKLKADSNSQLSGKLAYNGVALLIDCRQCGGICSVPVTIHYSIH